MLSEEIIRATKEVMKRPPEPWSLSKSYFHKFYTDNIKGEEEGWSRDKCEDIRNIIESYSKKDWPNFTETLLDKVSDDLDKGKIVQKLIEIVKICDVDAYHQDNAMPVVAKTMMRQNYYFEKILKWKLEPRRSDRFQDILDAQNLTPSLKNTFLCLSDPSNYIFMVSPGHRKMFITALIDAAGQSDLDDPQWACVKSNDVIKGFFLKTIQAEPELLKQLIEAPIDRHFFTRVISHVLYDSAIRSLWDKKERGGGYLILSIKEGSPWEDQREDSYQYGPTVPNYKKMAPGVNFLLHEKNVGFIGCGTIEKIDRETSNAGGSDKYRAYYSSFTKLDPPYMLTEAIKRKIELIPGYNSQHAIKQINQEVFEVVANQTQTRFWQIAPGENARLWNDLRINSIVAVGWPEIDLDLSRSSEEEVFQLQRDHNPNAPENSNKIQARMLWNFLNLKPGDKFLVNRGRRTLLALGTIKGGYKFQPEREEYRHTYEVEYYKIAENEIAIPDNLRGKFGKTITPLSKDEFQRFEALFGSKKRRSWVFQANPKYYRIKEALIELSEILWKVTSHQKEIEIGDRVYFWQSGPEAALLAVGTVASAPALMKNEGKDEEFMIKPETFEGEQLQVWVHIDNTLDNPIPRSVFLADPILSECSIINAPQGTNFALTEAQANCIEVLIGKKPMPGYTVGQFEGETGFRADQIEKWKRNLVRKKHVIFQGPPGTGKTFVAHKLARLLISGTKGFIETVQFHPAYAYEDFVQGIRPEVVDGKLNYKLEDGHFKRFCQRCATVGDGAPCVMVIDEINRSNISKVFGELMYLLEYRNERISLSSGGTPFEIPENAYLIGTMNTADRSIALVDHALRRRFSFIRLSPDYEVLKKHLEVKGYPAESLLSVLKEINRAISDPNYEIGISFFMGKTEQLKEHLPDIWGGEIEPYLEEYFYDDLGKVTPFRWERLIENRLREWVI